MPTSRPSSLPQFSDLPLNKADPYLSAWGLYGPEDQLGFLNRLTNELVVEASKEIQTGERISVNWPLDAQAVPFFGRHAFQKDIIHKSPRCVNDDVWSYNTQSSTQWDGLRHFAYQREKKFYNGVTMEDIHEKKTNVNGIHVWAERGIVGRGILLDYHSWRIQKNIPHEAFETSSIRLEHLKAVAEAQGTEIKFGDILFVRSGYMVAYNSKSQDELQALAKRVPPGLAGVEQSENMLKWIWDNFSAVAGDHPSWECWPTQKDYSLHEVLLSGWGCPIGELFDLETLASHCEKTGRYSFFVTSEPSNVPGGVASPPNMLAIF